MPVTTKQIICSKALVALGCRPVADVEHDDEPNSVKANELYEVVRDEMLRDHFWNFATRRVLLAPDAAKPAWGFPSQFTLPGDFLRIVQVGKDGEAIPYKVEGRKILSSGDALRLIYICRAENEAEWDASFTQVMIQAMKYNLTYPVTQSTQKEQQEYQILKDMLQTARSIDGQEEMPETLGDNPIVMARYL
jgi:hypothetical protein